MNFRFFSRKKLAVLLHILAWTIFIILPMYFLVFYSQRDSTFLYRVYMQTFVYVLIFYINYIWLIPKIFIKGSKAKYFVTAALTILAFYLVIDVVNTYVFTNTPQDTKIEAELNKISRDHKVPSPPRQWHIYNYLFTSSLITGFCLGLKLTDKYMENEKQRKELEKERLNSELAFLKNQISPHFFFNTLNNIYSLVQINTDDAQKSILKLSKLMRYLLYETEHGNIQLSQEIEFMKNYLDLMKLRLTQKVELKVSFPEKYTDASIPPLLFIPFIENALKHGVSYRDHSFIHIAMEADEQEIRFTCANSIFTKTEETTDSGIGLENIKKRLNLLFPEKHKLKISQTDAVFQVELNINVNAG